VSRAAEAVAEDARHSPLAVFALPEVCEAPDAIQFLFLSRLRQVKAMLSDCQRSIVVDGANL
jgi:hypothetical protein